MTAWRPITGTITRLDPDLTSEQDIQRVFASEYIIGRGSTNALNPAQFDFEVAVAGRKLRVATLDESHEIIKGRSLENLAGYVHEQLRKVEVSLNGTVLHGPLDIGAVDIDDDVIDDGVFTPDVLDEDVASPEEKDAQPAGAALSAGKDENGTRADDARDDSERANSPQAGSERVDIPAIPQGRGFALAEIATSEIPVLATAQHQSIGAVKVGDVRLLLADHVPYVESWMVAEPPYTLLFVRSEQEGRPLLVVRRMGREKRWDWSGERPPFAWLALPDTPAQARDFTRDELGAGGMARAAVADVLDAAFATVREALLVPASQALPALVSALGLPSQVASVVMGEAGIETVPEVRIFQPQGAATTFTEALAWEVAGEGRVHSGLAGIYRSLYLERPWLTSIVAAIQASVGGAVLMSGMKKSLGGSRSPWKIVAGTVLVANAISRIATTQYMASAMQRFVGDVSADEMPGATAAHPGRSAVPAEAA